MITRMIGAAASFAFLQLLPIDFPYQLFALILFLNGLSMGAFASPNRAGVMNSLPPGDRGASPCISDDGPAGLGCLAIYPVRW